MRGLGLRASPGSGERCSERPSARRAPGAAMSDEIRVPARPETFGLLLGVVTIDGLSMPLYSNGDTAYVGAHITRDRHGRYLAVAYHCVEFVRRFVYEKYDVNLAAYWREGDADDWYAHRATMPLRSIARAECRPGDLVTFTGENTGHIAVVAEAGPGAIMIASQNLTNTATDLHTLLDTEILARRKPLSGQHGMRFFFESLMRVTL